MVIGADCLHKGSNEAWILAATRKFDPATDIYPERRERCQRAGDVVRA
jgi:hypothetical protein